MPTIGGGICWGLYLLFIQAGASVFTAVFLSAACIGLIGEISAYHFKMPTTVCFMPACVPLIPGSSLYYMLRGMISQNWEAARQQFILLVLYALGIALGLALIPELNHIRVTLNGVRGVRGDGSH